MVKWIISLLIVAVLTGVLVRGFLYRTEPCHDPSDEELRFLGLKTNATIASITITTEYDPPYAGFWALLFNGGEMSGGSGHCSDLGLRELMEEQAHWSKGPVPVHLVSTAGAKTNISTIQRALDRLVGATPKGTTLSIVVHVP
jgi:hypothetical protein